MKLPTELKYADVAVGEVWQFEKKIFLEDVARFSELTGDKNPLHVDPAFGAQSKFSHNIVHGMLAGSLFSTIIGMHCPGKHSLYLGQTLNFRKPVFVGDAIIVRGTLLEKTDSLKMVTIKTEILKDGVLLVDGIAKASFLQ